MVCEGQGNRDERLKVKGKEIMAKVKLMAGIESLHGKMVKVLLSYIQDF